MARRCDFTGKGVQSGHNVSHANNKTKTRSIPNLQTHRFFVPSMKRWVKLRVSAHGLRIINRRGIEKVVAQLRADGEI